MLFRKASLGEEHIKDTIELWEGKSYQNAIVNRIWELLPRFVVLATWKEQNSWIFENRKQSLEEVWTMIHGNIMETLGITKRGS